MGEDDLEFGVAESSAAASSPGDFRVERAGTALDTAEAAQQGQALDSPTLADLYMRQGHFQEAARIFANLLAKRPGDAYLLSRLAECQRHMEAQSAAPAAGGAASGNVLATLERWLANARRLQAAR